MNYSDDFREMIAKYNEELRKINKKAKPYNENEVIPAQASVENAQTSQTPQTDGKTTAFPFTNDYTLPNISPDQMIKGQTTGLTGEGSLIVRVSVANAAAPIQGASVLISFEDGSGEKLVKSMITDVNGETKKIMLPTVPLDESLEPGIKNPYASYLIRVSADGYFTIDSINVPIFDKQTAIQPVEMLPLPENFKGETVLKSNDTGSITLN